ncbi:MAG: hypothetical protein HONBIEJF_00971 [Fimbriimonadaceae bacterium]|nr:hypothetical protein [Fimbriimonadaceae bacterium]
MLERHAVRLAPDEWIEALLEVPADQVERDRLRDPVENLQWELAKEVLELGCPVVLENGFWSFDERTQYAMEAIEIGAEVELHYLAAPSTDELWMRIEERNARLEPPTFVMSREEHESAWRLFEPPSTEELAFYDAFVVHPVAGMLNR